MKFRTIMILLIVLLTADIIITSVAVGCLGATEMNPLYYRIGGLHAFIVLKVIASVVAIAAIVLVERTQPKTATFTAVCVCGMYSGVLLYSGMLLWDATGILS